MSRLDVDDTAELLAILWPALDDALARDQGATDGDKVSAAGIVPAAPVNADVLSTMTAVGVELRLTAAWAASVIGGAYVDREPVDQFRHAPCWHHQMMATGATLDAEALAGTLARWLRAVKLALRLAEPDRRLGQYCPRHDAPLVELVAPGADAAITWTRIVGGRPLDPRVDWRRTVGVFCRHCEALWQPGEYLALERELRIADARRLVAGEAAA